MFGVFYELAVVGRANAKRLGADVHRVFTICGCLTLFMWMLYPVAWGLCEGGNVITPDDEAFFYGCLDFMAKPVFSIALLWGHWNIRPERLGLSIMSAEERAEQLLKKNDGPAPNDYGTAVNEPTTTA
jgi:bacteriorhodopsin